MDSIISSAARIAKVNLRNDDDIVDRLNHRYTVLFLVIFTAVVSTTQYVGEPIACWCPAYFTENHVEYTNKVSVGLID
jgi:innexin